MKTIKFLLSACFLVAIVMLTGCHQETDVISNTKSNLEQTKSSAEITAIEDYLSNYFNLRYQILIEPNENRSEKMEQSFSSFFSNPDIANSILQEINDHKRIVAMTDSKYTDYEVALHIDPTTFVVNNATFSFIANVRYSLTTNARDEESGEIIVTEGLPDFEYTLTKKASGAYIIDQEKPYYRADATQSLIDDYDEDPDQEHNDASMKTNYTYSASNAVTFALAHWDNVSNVTGYYDCSSSGGDCTNFLNWCLKTGGWAQTNNWFFKSFGSSGNNMNTYQRSPSWCGARYINEYITNSGMYQGINGNNRVTALFSNKVVPTSSANNTTWTSFYNSVKTLAKGDIVQIKYGSYMGHSMIVTKTTTSPPYIYLTFRNSSGNLPRKDREINLLSSGSSLYGYKVKTSGY
ncbi:MAG: amidase domain-containing protein [Bacteroidia bacterium]|nr:amidase domain-containing protein [Bacteroidia bacterium]